MPAKKRLLDYSRGGFGYTREHFSVDKAAELKRRYGFATDYDLHESLYEADGTRQMIDRIAVSDASPTVQHAELVELNKRTDALLESVRTLGHHASVAIALADIPINPRINARALSTLRITLRKLARASRKATERLPKARRGRKADDSLAMFLLELRRIYRNGTGEKDVVTHPPDSSIYEGNFFTFLRECLRTVGIRQQDGTYADYAKQAASYDMRIDADAERAASAADDFDGAWDEAVREN